MVDLAVGCGSAFGIGKFFFFFFVFNLMVLDF